MTTRATYVDQLARHLVAAVRRARMARSDRERADWQDLARALSRTIEVLERDAA